MRIYDLQFAGTLGEQRQRPGVPPHDQVHRRPRRLVTPGRRPLQVLHRLLQQRPCGQGRLRVPVAVPAQCLTPAADLWSPLHVND
jgi:hypothetical protein